MKTITTRLDDEAERALANLVAAAGTDQSKVLRTLIVNAERARVVAQARHDARALRDDPEYQADLKDLDDYLGPLSAW